MTFKPSIKQAAIFDWVKTGTGNALVIAVAGSGKSTTMVRTLSYIPERASVLMLAFGADAAADLRTKIEKLAEETGRNMSQVSARTFHSLGLVAVRRRLNGITLKTQDNKCRKIARATWDEDTFRLYAAFCTSLVRLAKGEGIGALVPDTKNAWFELIEHHDLTLESEEASLEQAVKLCQGLLLLSNEEALKGNIDYADMLYLPIYWKLALYGQSWVIVDEAQDSNPVRRCLAYMAMNKNPRFPGRLIAVGDPKQSIMGFTGATSDAMERIAAKFRTIELPLTVSYRCPKAVGRRAQGLVPYFEVHENAPEGEELDLKLDDALGYLGPADVVLCRNTRPLISLAYKLMSNGIACRMLGSEIGQGLIELIEQMNARTVNGLLDKLETFRERETKKWRDKEEDVKADAVEDRVACTDQ
jgi:DNA helicase-2/ATP-dependent DNA helicase PcrA